MYSFLGRRKIVSLNIGNAIKTVGHVTATNIVLPKEKTNMNSVLDYAVYFIPPGFVALSQMYKVRIERLKDSGKIPNIIEARQRQITFMAMAVLSLIIIVMVTQH